MFGLLIKDFCLLKAQKKFFLVVLALAIMMVLTNKDVTFMVGYVTMILPMFSLSTISYDEFDNGNPFLFTLPITRTQYIFEKYLFSLLTGVFSSFFSFGLACIMGKLIGRLPIMELLVSMPVMLSVTLVVHSILLPINIKFGAEKSRTAMLLTFGGIALLGVVLVKGFAALGVDLLMIFNRFFSLPLYLVLLVCALALVSIIAISVLVSVSIIKKKEF